MTKLAGWQVGVAALHHGFVGNNLKIAIAVAHAESGWRDDAVYHTSREYSVGLWQINTYAHPQYGIAWLKNANNNAQAAWQVYSSANHHWTPWTTYTRGTYQQYLGAAQQAMDQMKSMGYNPGTTSGLAPGSGSGSTTGSTSQLSGMYDYHDVVHAQAVEFGTWALEQAAMTAYLRAVITP